MKKLFVHLLLCVAGVLVFSSCSKDDDKGIATYTFKCNISSYWDTSVRLFEYNSSGDKIKNNSFECNEGYSKTFTASSDATKIKVYIDGKWVQQVYILKRGGNIVITVDSKTLVGNQEP